MYILTSGVSLPLCYMVRAHMVFQHLKGCIERLLVKLGYIVPYLAIILCVTLTEGLHKHLPIISRLFSAMGRQELNIYNHICRNKRN
jgi:hypothetical protein